MIHELFLLVFNVQLEVKRIDDHGVQTKPVHHHDQGQHPDPQFTLLLFPREKGVCALLQLDDETLRELSEWVTLGHFRQSVPAHLNLTLTEVKAWVSILRVYLLLRVVIHDRVDIQDVPQRDALDIGVGPKVVDTREEQDTWLVSS